jgi:hypothetical protein
VKLCAAILEGRTHREACGDPDGRHWSPLAPTASGCDLAFLHWQTPLRVDPEEQDAWSGLKKIGTKILNFSGKSERSELGEVHSRVPCAELARHRRGPRRCCSCSFHHSGAQAHHVGHAFCEEAGRGAAGPARGGRQVKSKE